MRPSADEDLAVARRALGPFVELQQAYEEIPYSYGRRYVVPALAASDPTFDGDVAVECLWDCEQLADDEAQAAAVRAAALARHRRSSVRARASEFGAEGRPPR